MEQLLPLERIFSELEPALVGEMKQKGKITHLEEGQVVMQSGQQVRSTLFLLSGLLKVYRTDDEGDEYFLYYIEPGEACALSIVCAYKQQESGVMMKAVMPSEVITIPILDTSEWLTKYPSWFNFVVSSYRHRFDELLATIDQVAFRSLDERLLFYLQKHLETTGINVHLSHQQIANELNSSREVISRLLKKMESSGKLKLHRNYIELISVE